MYLCDEIHEFCVLDMRIEAQRNDRKRERLYCSLGFDNCSFIFLCLCDGAVDPWLGRCALLFPWRRLTLETSTVSSLPLQSRLIYQFFGRSRPGSVSFPKTKNFTLPRISPAMCLTSTGEVPLGVALG